MRKAVIYVFLLTPLAAQQSDDVADRMWKDYQAVRWTSGVAEWRKAHRAATCREGHSDGGIAMAEDEWCHSCEVPGESHSSSFSFYAFDLEPLACRLLQVRIVSGLVRSEATYQNLRTRLSRAYGPGRDPGKVLANGSAYWSKLWLWEHSGVQTLLFVNDPAGVPHVELLARHASLVEAKAADVRLRKLWWEHREARERQLNQALAEQLRNELPKLPSMLLAEQPAKLDPETLQTHLRILLQLAAVSSADRRPALFMAADRLADLLRYHFKPPFQGEHRHQIRAGGFVLTCGWSHLGDVWVYDHALWWHVYENYPDSDWWKWAFLELQRRGWYTGVACPADAARFRRAIVESQRFLQRYPESSHRLDVLFDLAVAYETWWSVSQAAPDDVYVKAERYKKGAEGARSQAVQLYEEIVRMAPESDYAVQARRVLPRLRLRLDTGQRRFYCIYD